MAKAPRSLAGQVVAITGGARGIGRATASALIAQGARVAIGDIESELAERTAQELNLPNNPDVVAQDGDASQRLRAATGMVQGGLKVTAPEQGQLIKFSFDSTSSQLAALVANGVADSFINTSPQRRYEASAYARNFLERQINKTRGDLEKSERAVVADPPADAAADQHPDQCWRQQPR